MWRLDIRLSVQIVVVQVLLALVACQRNDAQEVVAEVQAPQPLDGTAQSYGIGIKCVLQRSGGAGVDARFEVRNQGHSIIEVQSVQGESASEVSVLVEVFANGKWEATPATETRATRLEELWPGATQYARTVIPSDVQWARVVAHARGLVRMKDGVTITELMDVSSDAFKVTASD